MPSHQALKDDQLLAEMYSGMAGGSLLLETPATKANIERFIKKYLSVPPFTASQSSPDPTDTRALNRVAMERAANEHTAKEFLDKWTTRLQQIIKAAGGNPDIFAYSTMEELEDVVRSSQVSRTEQKKAFKAATDTNIPLIFETDKYAVYQPRTWEASRKYFGINRESLLDGTKKKGATWCTSAAENPKHFNDYVIKRQDRLLYFIRKKDDVLFAARCKKTTDTHYQRWLSSRLPHSQEKIADIANSVEHAAAEEMRAWAREMEESEPAQLLEVRNQQNKRMWRLSDLLEKLTGKTISIPEYIAFIKLVIFEKTE